MFDERRRLGNSGRERSSGKFSARGGGEGYAAVVEMVRPQLAAAELYGAAGWSGEG